MSDAAAPGVLVVGVGNELRGDDGAGIEVTRNLRERPGAAGLDVRELHGDPIALLDRWRGRNAVVLTDTMRSEAGPGTIRRLDASDGPLPARGRGLSSTHATGLAETIELGRALGQLPRRVIVYAIEGRRFDPGADLSDEVRAAIPWLALMVLAEATALENTGADRQI